jgi:tRNA dimethylallyltransferase
MILVLTGATGTGKSEMAVSLAKAVDGEIINADAFQVYEGLMIATAVPSPALRREVIHHLYSFVPLDKGYDISSYQKDCRETIKQVLFRNKTPILVGGSGLYLRSALYDYDFSIDTSGVDMSPYEGFSDEALHQELLEKDPLEAAKIHPHNRRRVYRALQICLASKGSKSALLAKQKHQPLFPTLFFALEQERETLYSHLEERVEAMFEAGLLEETLPLIEKYGRGAPAFQAIGVKELFPYLDHRASLEETKDLIKENTRHYVKRQETFLRHQFPVISIKSVEDIQKHL